MSQENVELVRAICAPWELGDFHSVEWAHPQIEFGFADGPTPGNWTGLAAMGDAWREALGAFDRLEMEVDEYIPIDRERVLVLTTNTGRGKTSGFDLGELRTRSANLFHIRDGRVTKLVVYWERDRGLEAVGLSDPATSQENVELGYRAVAAWNARNIEAMLALTDPEVEYVNSPTSVEPGTKRGHESLVEVLRAQWEFLSDGRWEVDRVHERHQEIIGLGRISRRMPGSEARIKDRILMAIRFEDGRITRMEVLGFGQAEVRKALEAVGLSE